MSWLDEARGLGESLGLAFWPPRCSACSASLPLRPAHGLCDSCFAALERNDRERCHVCAEPGPPLCRRCLDEAPAFLGAVAPYMYRGVMTQLVQAAKFNGRDDVARALGVLLASARQPWPAVDVIVPVPLSWQRRVRRGFNQSALMAQALQHELHVPVRHLLRRRRHTRAQSDLPLGARRQNVSGAFAARQLSGRVLLVDDVATTGETLRAAAQALRQAGAAEVWVAVAARTPPGESDGTTI